MAQTPDTKRNLPVALLFAFVFVLGLGVRVFDLDRRPLHHDEGVNGWLSARLFQEHVYRYDPRNFHGPLLYYLNLAPFRIAGLTDVSLRLMTALFGAGLLLLFLPLRKRVGDLGAAVATLLIAVSPGAVYYSRCAIHETYLSFFTMCLIASAVLWADSRKTRWLYAMAVSLALMATVKESYVLTAAVLAVALAAAWLFAAALSQGDLGRWLRADLHAFQAEARSRGREVVVACALFAGIVIVFYSSFSTYPRGVAGFFSNLPAWTGRATGGSVHDKPFGYYFSVLLRSEAPILIGAIVGALFAIARRELFSIFTFAWALGMFMAYSAIPYKTPWLALNMLLPMALLTGIGVEDMFCLARRQGKWLIASVMLAAAVWSGYQTADLNFFHYDDNSYDYVYAHTSRRFLSLVERIARLSGLAEGRGTKITVSANEQWPLVWYLRGYSNVTFWDDPGRPVDGDLVVANEADGPVVRSNLFDEYHQERFNLRPGVDLVLFVQKQIWEEDYRRSLDPQQLADAAGAWIVPGLAGRYFAGGDFAGEPFLVRSDAEINFDWQRADPRLPDGPFCVEWGGHLWVPQTGAYGLEVQSHGRTQIWLNGQGAVEADAERTTPYAATVSLSRGGHALRVRYASPESGGAVRLLWKPPGGEMATVPATVLYSLQAKLPGGPPPVKRLAHGVIARYYAGTEARGKPLRVRVEDVIGHHWDDEAGKPVPSPLSVEWEGWVLAPEDGAYLLVSESDDGCWVFVDDRLIVDNGGAHATRRVSGWVFLGAGYHRLRVRYFDKGQVGHVRLQWRPPKVRRDTSMAGALFHVEPE